MQLDIIEPHRALLKQPPDNQLLYKVMSVENLIRSVSDSYLYFNRINGYKDFPDDGRQLPKDLPGNIRPKFESNQIFSAADYYDKVRSETYACCFSLVDSKHIWEAYGNEGRKGKICLVFDFGRLRTLLNDTLCSEESYIESSGSVTNKIFSINYGIVEYDDWKNVQKNQEYLVNPIEYTYLKDSVFKDDNELRVSLSRMDTRQAVLKNGNRFEFTPSLNFSFDYKAAKQNGAITDVKCSADCDIKYLQSELKKLGITIETR